MRMTPLFIAVKIMQNQPTSHSSIRFLKENFSLGDKCKAPHAELRPRYKYILFKAQLHPSVFECSETYGDYSEVNAKVFVLLLPKYHHHHRNHNNSKKQKRQSLSSSFVTKTAFKPAATTKQPVVKGTLR